MSDYTTDRPRLDEWAPEMVRRSPAAGGDYASIPDFGDASSYYYCGFHPLDIRRCDGCGIREREAGFLACHDPPLRRLGQFTSSAIVLRMRG